MSIIALLQNLLKDALPSIHSTRLHALMAAVLRVNILSGSVANKLSGLCDPIRREHEPGKMATGDKANAIRRCL